MGVLLALAAAASWGVAMTVAKPASRYFDPISFLLLRWGLTLPVALLFGLATRSLALPGTAGGWVVLGSILNAVIGWILYLLAMERAPGYQVAGLASTAPMWGVIGAILFVGEPFRWTALTAALIVVIGATFLSEGKRAQVRGNVVGTALALTAGVLWGVSETVPMKLAADAGVSSATSIALFSATALAGNALALPLLRWRIPRRTHRAGFVLVAVSALFGSFLGWLLWLAGLRIAPASLLAPVRGSVLLFTFVYSVVFLRERPSRRAALGVLSVFGGVILASLSM